MDNLVSYRWVVGILLALLGAFGTLYVNRTDARLSTLEVKQDVDSGAIPAMREEIKAVRESLSRIEDLLKERRR